MTAFKKNRSAILIVEDYSVIASVEEWRLKQMRYDFCGHATNGTDAIALVKEKKRLSFSWISTLKGRWMALRSDISLTPRRIFPVFP